MARGALGGDITTTESRRAPVIVTRDETPVTKRNNVTPVTKLPYVPPEAVKEVHPLITRRKGRPKKHEGAAARQRAYRERSK